MGVNGTPLKVTQDVNPVAIDTNSLLPFNIESSVYRTYRIRYLLLFTLFLLNLSNAALWITYSTVADIASAYFDVSLTAVNLLSLAFYVGYVLFSLVSSWAIDTHGLRWGLIYGATGNVAGAWLRYIAVFLPIGPHGKYALTMIAQCLAAISQPFMLNAPTKLAATWFKESERATANMVATIANPLGIAVGSILVPSLCTDQSTLPLALLSTAILASVTIILVPFLPSLPPTPPGPLPPSTSTSFLPGITKALKVPSFLVLLFGFSVVSGNFSAISTLLQNIVTPYGYSNDQAGFMGALMILGGLIGAVIAALWVDRTGKHILVLKTMLPLDAVIFICLIFAVKANDNVGLLVVSFLLGMFTFSLLPVALELGVETTYPLPEATSAGILWMSSQFLALIFQLIMNGLRQGPDAPVPNTMTGALVFAAATIGVVSLVVVFGFHSTLKRREAEQARQHEEGS